MADRGCGHSAWDTDLGMGLSHLAPDGWCSGYFHGVWI